MEENERLISTLIGIASLNHKACSVVNKPGELYREYAERIAPGSTLCT